MVALNEKFSHSGNLVSGGQLSPDVIDGFGFTKRSEEVRGGSVAIFGGAGFRGLSDASPLRRRSPAPLNRNDPETELYYVRNRMYNPALGRWVQRDPIGYSGGINLYEYVGGSPATILDPSGLLRCVPCWQCQKTLDQEEAQAIHQIEQEAVDLGMPGSLTVWKIVGGTIVTASAVGAWGGIWGAVVGAGIGGVEAIGKVAELAGLIDQMNAEIQSDIAAYKNCMRTCSN